MSATPLVSIIMPVYNGDKYLHQAINSILNQIFTNFEFIIIDDGSTDSSKNIISRYDDSRIRFYENSQNIGLAASLNKCVILAEGKYIARMDQDDVSYPERLSKQILVLENDSSLDLTATCTIEISESGDIVRKQPFALEHDAICSKPWRGFYMPHPTWMGKAQWFRDNQYGEPSGYYCEDQELLLESYLHSKFKCLPEVLLAYRLRDSVNLKKLLLTRYFILLIQIRNFIACNRFIFVCLSLITFILKVALDILKYALHYIFPGKIIINSTLPESYFLQWLVVQKNTETDVKEKSI
jgi:glycosyltransferase involved in cell wall biosynthesis